MDSKELRGLMEAYSEVYAPQQIDEISAGLAGKVVNARIAATGAAADRENRARTPQNVRDTVAASDKEARARKLAAGVRKRRVANEEFELWVNELVEEGYDLSDYTWDEMYKFYLDEALTGDRIKKAIKKPGGTNYTRMHSADPEKRPTKRGGRGERGTSKQHDFGAADRGAGNKAARRAAALKNEELDIFDVVLEFLQVEGYAETLEEAEWIMANVIDEEVIDTIIDEAITSEKGKAKAAQMIAARSTPSGRAKSGQGANVAAIKHIGRANVDNYGGTPPNLKIAKNPVKSNFTGLNTGSGNKAARRAGTYQEEFELWVDSLVEEGYDLSEYTWDEMFDIYEAEGSYGQTPKARTAMGKLAIGRMRKPASEYSQRGEKTKKLKAAEKHTRRQDTLSQGKSGGKKSSRPWGIRGKMDADDRAEARAKAVEYGEGGTYGAGGVAKNPKKLRKQKAMGEHD